MGDFVPLKLKIMKKYIWLLFIFALGCSPCKYVSKHPECFPKDTLIVDTVIYLEETTEFIVDSTSLELYIECDSNYNVLIRDYIDLYSEKKDEKIKIVYKYKNNILQIKSYADSIEVLNSLVETLRTEKHYTINPINTQLQKDLDKCQEKVKKKNWLWWAFGSVLMALIIVAVFIFKIKR